MKSRLLWIPALVLCAGTLFPSSTFAQDKLPRFGIGAKMSTLGIGIEAATAVTHRSNVRGAFNFFDYNHSYHNDGIDYAASLTLRSVQVMYDQYIVGGFHVSPGVLIYNGNKADATASVPAGQSFGLGNATYFSNTTNPIKGTATLDTRNVAPLVLVGFGNLLPRSGRHFGVNFDGGVAFQGSPNMKLNLTGTACAINPTTGCVNAATDPNVQSSVQQEQAQVNDDLKKVKYYPIVSLGFSWKF